MKAHKLTKPLEETMNLLTKDTWTKPETHVHSKNMETLHAMGLVHRKNDGTDMVYKSKTQKEMLDFYLSH